jgi:hypothetical protein
VEGKRLSYQLNMSRLTLVQGLLRNLAQEIDQNRREFIPREEAYLKLKKMTGQDFGYDVPKWRQWFKNNPKGATK